MPRWRNFKAARSPSTPMAHDPDQTIRLTGSLTLDEVPTVYERYLEWRENGTPAVIDLSGLEASDSSAVALLLEWLGWARASDREIRFENPPEALRTLAGLSQADEILGWTDE